MHALSHSPPSEHDLLIDARNGDAVALEQFCRQRFRWMKRIAVLELGEASRADDAVQDAFVQLLNHLDSWDPTRPFEPWLATVVRNAARMRRRRWRPWAVLAEHSAADDLERTLDLQRAGSKVAQALQQLTAAERQAVYHVDVLGMSATDAADLFEKSPSTLRVLLHRARHKLRELLPAERDLLESK